MVRGGLRCPSDKSDPFAILSSDLIRRTSFIVANYFIAALLQIPWPQTKVRNSQLSSNLTATPTLLYVEANISSA